MWLLLKNALLPLCPRAYRHPFIGGGEADDLTVSLFGTESFHNGDYALFFDNIKQNVKTRIDSYFEKLESRP